MRPLPLLLALSLASNAALISALVLRPTLAPPAMRDFFIRTFSSKPASRPTAPLTSATASTTSATATAVSSHSPLWARLRTDNLRDYVARLRAAGFPAATIRALIEAELQVRYGTRINALEEPDASVPFWQIPPTEVFSGDTATRKEIMALQRELRQQLHDLLDDDFFHDDESLASERRKYGNLSSAKIAAVRAIEDDYSELERLTRGSMRGVELPEDRDAFTLMRREKSADLAALLTPQEFAEYELHRSSAARQIRAQLALFPATEEEYRTLVRLRLVVEEQSPVPPGGFFTAEDNQRRNTLLADFRTQLQAAFGEERYAEYTRDTTYEYRQLAKLAREAEVPAESVALAWGLRDRVARESNRILDDPALDDPQRRAALRALAQDTRVQYTQTLGASAGPTYAAVEESWLKALERGNAVSFVNGRSTIRPPVKAARP